MSKASVNVTTPTTAPVDMTPVKPVYSSEIQERIAQYAEQVKRDQEIVRGRFVCHETPTGSMGFPYKKHKGEQITTYTMKDNDIYSIPRGVALHLNADCSYPSYSYKDDENGRPRVVISERIRRCSFQSLEFFDSVRSDVKGYRDSALPTA